ncbi:unnamed protein product [Hyaloperonospora brassicae]|uniref:Uncharacterized protein n=1 Tax=Hyaloperonospora brassicae TaxID=162125 RepID=A0AAV0UCM5_HYABA|nr:unnamed protein product [Hyaloperonospora brassicae]
MAVNADGTLHESYLSFVQATSTCVDFREQENSALRAQVHDLTELLAVFNLCGLHDPHLIAVRDRAFRRDITSNLGLLQAYDTKRQMLQESIRSEMKNKEIVEGVTRECHQECSKVSECLDSGSSVLDKSDSALDCLYQRVELLEREVVILRLRQELLEETTPRLECPSGNVEADQTSQDQDVENEQEQRERDVLLSKCWDESTRTTREQQERIAELEDALTLETAKNAALQQQSRGYRKVQTILQEFSRHRSSAS